MKKIGALLLVVFLAAAMLPGCVAEVSGSSEYGDLGLIRISPIDSADSTGSSGGWVYLPELGYSILTISPYSRPESSPLFSSPSDIALYKIPESYFSFDPLKRPVLLLMDGIFHQPSTERNHLFNGFLPRPPGVQLGQIDISIKEVVITKDLPEGIDPDEVSPIPWVADPNYTKESVQEYLEKWFPKLCYMFVTFEVTNQTQQTIITLALAYMLSCMIDAEEQIRVNALRGSPVYLDYSDYPFSYDWDTDFSKFLRLLPGETREVTVGYYIDQKRWIDETSESEWSFLIGYSFFNVFAPTEAAWLLDYDKITYVGVERNK